MRAFKFLLFFLSAYVGIDAAKQFRLGRSRGGNIGAPAIDDGETLPPAQWFEQKLDHASPSDIRTWQQRYYINDSFFDRSKKGPVFLMIGGEGPADPRWMVAGAWIDYAKKFHALCINLEHRFYGESQPLADLSVKNLQYLSSDQALADLAHFINSINIGYQIDKSVKWVAFGGSYPGSLAAWLRLKYPHLVHGAISSSGPLLAKINFGEYFQVVAKALTEKTGNTNCVQQVKLAHEQLVGLIENEPETAEKEFKVCKPFSEASENDIKNFYNSIADDFADLVQYNEDNRISSDGRFKNLTINNVCALMTAPDSKPAVKKLAAFNSIMLDKANDTCLDYSYDKMIKDLQNVSINHSEGGRQWMYQTCTEFGFFQTSSCEKDLFGDQFSLDFFTQQCQDVFGSKYNDDFIRAAADWTNNKYGGLQISVTRVVFVHGSIDPWHALGIISSDDVDTPAIYINGTAHCANMYPASKEDSKQLVAARALIQRHLQQWFI